MNTEPTCNFCGKKAVAVHKLITADDVAICDACVNASHKGESKIFFQETSCSCSFCDKYTENVAFILSSFWTPKKSICNECLELCDEILEEDEKKKNTPNSVFDAKLRCSFCGKSEPDVLKLIGGPGVYICDGCAESANEVLSKELPLWSWKQELASRGSEGFENSTISRSIEFPAKYRDAVTSILTYFSHALKAKHPDVITKVTIEQDDLILRMIIDTPTGKKEIIEKTLEEYGMVIAGRMEPEIFFQDPFEVMALKNKLEIANLELRQMQKLMDFGQNNNKQRIESLEVQVEKLHSIIEKGLNSGNNVIGVINKMAEQDKATYDLKNAKFGGGFAAEGGLQVGGQLIDLSSANSLADAAKEIQELLQQLQKQGISPEDATQQAANDLAEQAKANPGVMSKVVKWGMDTAGKTTVGEATKGVIKLTLQMLGIPLP